MQIETTCKVMFGMDEKDEALKFQTTHTEREGWIKKAGNYSIIFTKTERNEVKFKLPV